MAASDRLHALIERVTPTSALRPDGTWPLGTAPYTIETPDHGSRRVRITLPDGDTVSGTGATVDAALDALEAKLG